MSEKKAEYFNSFATLHKEANNTSHCGFNFWIQT